MHLMQLTSYLFPQNIDKKFKNLFIIDDSMLLPQSVIKQYFTHGRHNNINVIYLTQSYFHLDKKSIRDNANYLILFPLGKTDIKNLYQFLTSSDFDKFDDFQRFCKNAWGEKHNFINIDKFNTDVNKRYGSGFKSFLDI